MATTKMPRAFFKAIKGKAKMAKNAFVAVFTPSDCRVTPGAFEMLIAAYLSH
jgi:hypothetical protein